MFFYPTGQHHFFNRLNASHSSASSINARRMLLRKYCVTVDCGKHALSLTKGCGVAAAAGSQ